MSNGIRGEARAVLAGVERTL
ncbi:MAG: hypothetical protein JWR59_256, partial [Brevundimonas sp.]|nr:hypothetical protein [Brevundimonas sp.]